MRVFAISDLHIDYEENYVWLSSLSDVDYQDDIIIIAGDLTDIPPLFTKGLEILKDKFKDVLFVPGNHDLWVIRNNGNDSLEQFHQLKQTAEDIGVITEPYHHGALSIVPLYGWYDFTFGEPKQQLKTGWMDFTACKWPENIDETDITNNFVSMNEPFLKTRNKFIISFSHFLPRIDLMPSVIPPRNRLLYPVLGSILLESQIRKLGSDIHVYGHSHVNIQKRKGNITYINNAFGYPSERLITAKKLMCIFEI